MNELTPRQKSQNGHNAFQFFANQFGDNDIVKEAFMDILLEVIYGEKRDDLLISGSKRQKDSENISKDREGEMPTYEIE